MTIAELIARLQEQRATLQTQLEGIVATAAGENRAALSVTEQGEYDRLRGEIDSLDARVHDLQEEERRQAEAAAAARTIPAGSGVRTRTQEVYARTSPHSFFIDVYRATRNADRSAMDRLIQHRAEQAEEVARRQAIAERMVEELYERGTFRLGRRDIEFVRSVETRAMDRTPGSADEFVPPLWLIDEYAALARAGRVFADAYNVRPLPGGTDSINIPRVTTGTLTGIQTADNAAVASQDLVSATLSVPVRTIAGQVDVAIQLLEQSPIAFDEVLFADLMADYNLQLDAQVINGSGASGQILGLLGVSGINATTYTDASPALAGAGKLYAKMASAVNDVATNRKLPPTRVFMAPRRWYWATAQFDSNNRPLITPTAGGPHNALSTIEDVEAEGGPLGNMHGLPVYIDPNIPQNLGAGTNEDRIIASRFLDHWLWESFLRTRILPEVGSGTLTVRLQVYSYAAATAGRYPKATSSIAGTGLVTPTF
jgi:HK97 family phage major capsid protein